MQILPFINQYNLGICLVTFDQPFYTKVAEIAMSSQNELCNISIRLDRFHLLMSYMEGIGYAMGGCGIDMWERVHVIICYHFM